TKGTIFHYFKSKEGILLAILDEIAPLAMKKLGAIVEKENLNGLEKLESVIKLNLDLVIKKSNFLRLLISESRHLSKDNRRIYRHYQRKYVDLTEEIVKQVQSENVNYFKNMNSRIVVQAILGMCLWATMWLSIGGKKSIPKGDVANHFIRILMEKL
ncbi:MAG: TetR family transcriptional regulator, partial [Deltaproteobacteria bacterium]|nr:TetR family transcriptional regulator [Deltaproteobacteria bacterium]